MNILHTSDWHLGRSLCGRSRYDEFAAFLNWLIQAIDQHAVDLVLVAGDVFDSNTPSNRAQALYYQFLCQVAASHCRHVVIIAGNHDSPSFLNAPRELLQALNVYVIGQACENPEDEVLVLADNQGLPELIVCAVPYLRDRDIRLVEAGESIEDKGRKLIEGIRHHYTQVTKFAQQRRQALGKNIPIIAMGHVFTSGGQTIDGDGVRELYIGSLAHVNANIFPECLSYVALGHLHVPQIVGGNESIRYSGSPLPMGFGEAKQQKSICLIGLQTEDASVASANVSVQLIDLPVFQKLERISGDWRHIAERIAQLSLAGAQSWLEIVYQGEEIIADLRNRLDAAIADTNLTILRIKNNRIMARALVHIDSQETLDDLHLDDVFQRCLDAHDIDQAQRPALLASYKEAVLSLSEDL